jgi:hypothetical protein
VAKRAVKISEAELKEVGDRILLQSKDMYVMTQDDAANNEYIETRNKNHKPTNSTLNERFKEDVIWTVDHPVQRDTILEFDTSKLKEFAFTDNNDEENIHPEDQQAVPKRAVKISETELKEVRDRIMLQSKEMYVMTQDDAANNEYIETRKKHYME